MERKIGPTIHDILETIERVQGKIAGKSFAEFEADWELTDLAAKHRKAEEGGKDEADHEPALASK